MRLKYEEFLAEGTLVVMEGAILDMMRVYDDLNDHIIQNQYTVVAFGYDPYNAKDLSTSGLRNMANTGWRKSVKGLSLNLYR